MNLFAKERPMTPSWDLLQPSIALLRKNVWQILYLSFLPYLLLGVGLVMLSGPAPTAERALTPHEVTGLGIVAFALIWVLLFYPAYTYFQVKAAQGHSPTIGESFKKGMPKLLPLLVLSTLAGFAVLVGLIAFIVPAFILIRGFYLAPYYLVDQNLGPVEALKKSYQESQPVSGWIWGVIGVELVIGLLSFFLGRIPVAGYLLSLAVGYLYAFGPVLRYTELATGKKPVVNLS